MTSLAEFLSTASADHQTALTEARTHTETRGRMITSDVMTMLLVGNGLYAEFSDLADDVESPARGILMAFMDRVRTDSVFNFQADHPKGQANLDMVDALVQMLPDLATELGELKAATISEASETVTPFANATLHDVLIEREAVPTKAVTAQNGWVTITLSADVETHNPRLLALNDRTGELVRVNSFRGVGAAGVYDCQVPREWAGASLFVDDVFGLV